MLSATCGKIGREIYTLMKQEFGEVTKLLRKQIDDLFKAKPKTQKKGDVIDVSFKPGKDKKGTDDTIFRSFLKALSASSSHLCNSLCGGTIYLLKGPVAKKRS